MTRYITAADVRRDLIARREIALLDLREENPFAADHPLFGVCLPLSRLEVEILDRLPRKDVRVVLYDNGEGLTDLAEARLALLGYTDVSVLDGGLDGWRRAGFELFQDVNSASKAFGELVEARRHTPSLTAPEVRELIESKANLVVLDARRFDEYNTMSIPTGVSVPGAELVLRAREIAPDPSTAIIVNCAGRTRSLIGAQSLINAGVPNPVAALRNGTIGWTLADQVLERGQTRRFPDAPPSRVDEARRAARKVSYRAGVKHIDLEDLAVLQADLTRTLYRFDVRTPEEYAAGHIDGFRFAPGGQLVQETDHVAAVRGARIVLADDLGSRADMSASWLAQMGWEVYVLDAPAEAFSQTGGWTGQTAPLPAVPRLEVEDVRAAPDAFQIIDVGPSPAHRRGHIPGAAFAIRAQLKAAVAQVSGDKRIVLTSPDGVLAAFAAADIGAAALSGGTNAWIAAGQPLETGLTDALTPPEDVYRRPYEGTDNPKSAMQAYLDWEFGLVEQLERDGTHGFFVI